MELLCNVQYPLIYEKKNVTIKFLVDYLGVDYLCNFKDPDPKFNKLLKLSLSIFLH